MKKLSMVIPLALILCFVVGCQDREAMAELEAMKAKAEVEEQNVEIIKRWLEEMDKGNLAVIDEICTEDYKCYLPGSPKPINREVYKQVMETNLVAFPNYNHTVEDVIAQGDKVVVRVTNRGTHKGRFGVIPPTGKEIKFSVMTISRLVEGKVAEMWANFDALGLYQQLGMQLKPKEGEK
jgi:predicted ester cyclase